MDDELKQHLGLRVRSIDRKHYDCFTFYRVQNIQGQKAVVRSEHDSVYTFKGNTRE